MASVVISGDTSGSVTLSAPTVAGSSTQTLVAATGTLAPLVSGTAVASTSGTSIDFTGIPSWVKRITVMFQGVSKSGTSNMQIQLGSGSIQTTGYLSTGSRLNAGGVGSTASSTGLAMDATVSASDVCHGNAFITNISGNNWTMSSVLGYTSAQHGFGGGSVTLSGVLDRIRITTVNGTDTFDAGSINIMYE